MNIRDALLDFSLPDLDGRLHRLQDYRGRIAIVNFWSCECPHAVRTDSLLTEWMASWMESVALLPIASNANESAAAMKSVAAEHGLPVVLVDEEHRIADLFEAQTTPHVFVIDSQGVLRYSGAVDDVNFKQRRPQRYFLREMVEEILHGLEPSIARTEPYGCAIVRHALE